ncbi:MAG: hypothetical protein EAY65_02570 [Alphaproteobacteria bacterium]|nr:MAG: hypothetical protein EAY65_02570 [Alphaproteobacteria bacterium]
MASEVPFSSQIDHLQQSKYDLKFEGVKGFVRRAAPAMLTFGLGAMALTGVGLFSLGFLGAMGVSGATALSAGLTGAFGGIVPALIGTGVLGGGIAASAVGVAGAVGARRNAQEHNNVIETQIAHVQHQAKEAGVEIPQPAPPTVEPVNPAKNNALIQSIVQNGRKSVERNFSPKEIVMRAAQDATGTSFADNALQQRATNAQELTR